MMKIRLSLILLTALSILTSCFKEDEKVLPHDPGDVETVAIGLSGQYNYEKQVYFDLGSGQELAENLKSDWDLGFECGEQGWHIILNTSTFMVIGNTGSTDFEAMIDTAGIDWRFDKSDGNLDSTAIGDWVQFSGADSSHNYSRNVYVLNRGYDEAGNLLGLRKIVFDKLTEESFSFSYAMMDGSNENTCTILKDNEVNFVNFSFKNGGEQLSLAPRKVEWDLLFTQYTTMLRTNEGELYPYLLTGVLSNRNGVIIHEDSLLSFHEITINDTINKYYSEAIDEIGYDWKDIIGDVSGGGTLTYVIIEGRNYLIQDTDGFYYKLRFINFYNNDGVKGYPTFEYQKL